MRILSINDLLEVAAEVIPENEFNGFRTTAEQLAHHLAIRIATENPRIRYASPAVFEPGFGGLCVGFKLHEVYSPTATWIRAKDPDGEDI